MALVINNWWSAEIGTLEDAATAEGSTSVSTANVRSAAPGARHYRLPEGAATRLSFDPFAAQVADQGSGYIVGFWIYITDNTPAVGSPFFGVREDSATNGLDSSPTSTHFYLQLETNGNVSVRRSNGSTFSTIGTATNPFTAATWHFVEFYYSDIATTGISWELFVGSESVAPVSVASGTGATFNAGTDAQFLKFEDAGSSTDIDDIYFISGATSAGNRLGGFESIPYRSSLNSATPDSGSALASGTWLACQTIPFDTTVGGQYDSALSGYVICNDVGGSAGTGGPNTDTNIDASANIKAIKGTWKAIRGTGGTTEYYGLIGNSVDGTTASTDFNLDTSPLIKQFVTEGAGVPLSTEYVVIGFQATGPRGFQCYDMLAEVAHVPNTIYSRTDSYNLSITEARQIGLQWTRTDTVSLSITDPKPTSALTSSRTDAANLTITDPQPVMNPTMTPRTDTIDIELLEGPSVGARDTFTDSNSTSLDLHTMEKGSGWTESNGAWEIQNNRAVCAGTTPGAPTWVATTEGNSPDVIIDLTVNCTTISTGALTGIVFRYVDNNNFWFVGIRPTNQFEMYERTGAAWFLRDSLSPGGGVSTSTDYNLHVEAIADVISASLDGTTEISAISSVHNTATKHGMRGGDTGHQFENFTLKILGPNASADITSLLSRTEALALAIAEARSNALTSSRSDGLSITISDPIPDVAAVVTPDPDSLALSITEARSNALTSSRTDAANLTITDPQPAMNPTMTGRTDTLTITLDDAYALINSFNASDANLNLSIDESYFLANILSASPDILNISITDAPVYGTGLVTYSNRPDTLNLTIDSITTLFKVIALADTLGLSIDTLTSILVTSSRSDTLNITITDTYEILSTLQRIDSLNLGITADVISLIGTMSRTDALDITIAAVMDILLSSARTDSLALGISEVVETINAASQRTDTLALSIAEVTSMLSTLSRLDTLNLVSADTTQNILSMIRGDALSISITEDLPLLTGVFEATDTLDITLTELHYIFKVIERLDTLNLQLIEQHGIFKAIALSDTLSAQILEIYHLINSFNASDSLSIAITNELTETVTKIALADTLGVTFAEINSMWSYLSRVDNLVLSTDIDIAPISALHVFDTVSGTFVPDIITGTGLVTETRAGSIYCPDQNGDYQEYLANTVGEYYSNGNWYAYSGPALTNLITQSTNLTLTWTAHNTPVVTYNANGLTDAINTATVVTDDSTSAYKFVRWTETVANDGNWLTARIFVRKDSNTSRFPELSLVLSGGTTPVFVNGQINTTNGNVAKRSSQGQVLVTSNEKGTKWLELVVSVKNNNTGNTTAEVEIYPARSQVLGGINITATGSITVGQAELFSGVTAFNVKGASPVFTAGLTASINASNLVLPYNNFDNNQGYYFDWVPVGHGYPQSPNMPIMDLGVSGLLYTSATGHVSTNDGTSTLTNNASWFANQSNDIGLSLNAANNSRKLNVNGTWLDSKPFDGAYAFSGSDIRLFASADRVNLIRDLRGFNGTYLENTAAIDDRILGSALFEFLEIASTVPNRTDVLNLAIAETFDLINSFEASDTSPLVVTETLSMLSDLFRSDDLQLSISEVVALISYLERSDTLQASISEVVSILSTLARTDNMTLAMISTVTGIFSTSARNDTLNLSIDGISYIISTLLVEDTLNITLDGLSTIISTLNRNDTLSLSVAESLNMIGTLSRADALSISVSEAINILSSMSRADTLAATIDESTSNYLTMLRSDTLSAAISESMGILASLNRADVGSLIVAETTSILTYMSRVDALALSLSETTSIFSTLLRSDIGQLAISETTSSDLRSEASDNLALLISEAASIAGYLSGVTDTLEISASEIITMFRNIASTDNLNISLQDAMYLFRAMAVTDQFDVTLTDFLSYIVPLATSDTLSLTIDELVSVLESIVEVDADAYWDFPKGEKLAWLFDKVLGNWIFNESDSFFDFAKREPNIWNRQGNQYVKISLMPNIGGGETTIIYDSQGNPFILNFVVVDSDGNMWNVTTIIKDSDGNDFNLV